MSEPQPSLPIADRLKARGTDDPNTTPQDQDQTNPPEQTQDQSKTGTDWDGIRREYEVGQITLRALAAKYGLASHSGIASRAKAEGWQRDQSSRVRRIAQAKAVEQNAVDAVARGLLSEKPKDQEGMVDAAAAVQVEVVRQHKGIISRLHNQTAEILEVVEKTKKTKAAAGLCLDHLAKLTQVAGKLIPLERQAHGLDVSDSDKAHDHVPLADRLKRYKEAGNGPLAGISGDSEKKEATGSDLTAFQESSDTVAPPESRLDGPPGKVVPPGQKYLRVVKQPKEQGQ